jgi:hypothetical protein
MYCWLVFLSALALGLLLGLLLSAAWYLIAQLLRRD